MKFLRTRFLQNASGRLFLKMGAKKLQKKKATDVEAY